MGQSYKIDVQKAPDWVLCPHCQARNPLKAYCCLACFQVIHGGHGPSIWRRRVGGAPFVLGLGLLIAGSGILGLRTWVAEVERLLTNIQEQTNTYLRATDLAERRKIDSAKKTQPFWKKPPATQKVTRR